MIVLADVSSIFEALPHQYRLQIRTNTRVVYIRHHQSYMCVKVVEAARQVHGSLTTRGP